MPHAENMDTFANVVQMLFILVAPYRVAVLNGCLEAPQPQVRECSVADSRGQIRLQLQRSCVLFSSCLPSPFLHSHIATLLGVLCL
jgi:hypothetical protein